MADELLSLMVKRAAAEHPDAVVQSPPDRPKASGGKLAELLYLAGLGADVGTTAYGAHKGLTEEANPLIKWAGNKGAAPVVGGLGLATYLLSRKFLKGKKPGLHKGVMAGLGGAHGLAAASNLRQIGQAQQPTSTPATKPSGPPFPGAVQLPDGSWINPEFFKQR